MSHFATITTQINDIAALRSACQELGLQLLDNTTARGWSGASLQADHVIRLKGNYDIAVQKQTDGTYGLVADLYDGSVEAATGKGYGRLLQLYGVHKATAEARRRGLMVTRQQGRDGNLKLIVTGMR